MTRKTHSDRLWDLRDSRRPTVWLVSREAQPTIKTPSGAPPPLTVRVVLNGRETTDKPTFVVSRTRWAA